MIRNVFIHLVNEQPLMADLFALPEGGDRSISCTNVRTVDGKQPRFVRDRKSTFVIPLGVVRMIEAPAAGSPPTGETALAVQPEDLPPLSDPDEEPDEDLLARIRNA